MNNKNRLTGGELEEIEEFLDNLSREELANMRRMISSGDTEHAALHAASAIAYVKLAA